MGRPASDKKMQLVSAATNLFHRRGFASTSLAEVALHAAVPPGNVFYYFRSKNDLALAVADHWAERIDMSLAAFEHEPDPWLRLSAFIARAGERRADYAAAGCPIAAINRDLRQLGSDVATAPPSYARQLQWLADQFEAGGVARAAAERRARFLLSSIQGSFVLGHALGDAPLIGDVAADLKRWLATVRATCA